MIYEGEKELFNTIYFLKLAVKWWTAIRNLPDLCLDY